MLTIFSHSTNTCYVVTLDFTPLWLAYKNYFDKTYNTKSWQVQTLDRGFCRVNNEGFTIGVSSLTSRISEVYLGQYL